MMTPKARGFSLIELMIALAIVGILAAVVYPGYTHHIQRAGRADAKALLMQAQARQESFFGAHNRYAGNMTALGYGAATILSENKRYQVSVNATTVNSYLLQAKPNPASAQANDGCGTLTIDQVGVKAIRNQPTSATEDAADCWKG